MRTDQKSGIRRICLALFITIAILVIAGYMDSPHDERDRMTATDKMPDENPAPGTAATTGAASAQKPAEPVTGAPQSPQSAGPLAIDSIGDKTVGDLLVVSGTTHLPLRAPVTIRWKYGASGEDKVLANRPVHPGADGAGRFRFVFDTSGFKPGSYTMTVATGKKDVSASAQFDLSGTYRGTDTPL